MRDSKRRFALLGVLALIASAFSAIPALASHNTDIHSDNVKKLAQKPIHVGDRIGRGSDLAFQGSLIVAGSYDGTTLWRKSSRSPFIKQIGAHNCPGSQGDVSVLGNYAFVSIDSPSSNSGKSDVCNNTATNRSANSQGKEGIRIVDISDPTRPRQIWFMETDCGSHTHTLIPGGTTSYIYVSSYPLGAPTAECNAVSHGKISIIKFPTNNPKQAELSTMQVRAETQADPIGCHDIGVYLEKDLAVAACITESQIWDISDRAHPEIVSLIDHPSIEIHHSGAATWDGKYAVIGDEHAGAAATGGCNGDKRSTVGAMWFYDITNRNAPVYKGHYALPRIPPAPDTTEETNRARCTTHNYNILPMKSGRYVAVSAYYNGGLSVVDFTDPMNAQEIGHYLPYVNQTLPDMWSAYWYNGRIYTNDHLSGYGVGAFRMRGLGQKKVYFFSPRLNPQTQITNW